MQAGGVEGGRKSVRDESLEIPSVLSYGHLQQLYERSEDGQ